MIAVQSDINGYLLPAPIAVSGGRKRGREEVDSSAATVAAASTSSLQGSILCLLRQHDAEIDAVVRMHAERLREGLEEVGRRQWWLMAAAVEGEARRRLAEKEAQLAEARRFAALLEERVRTKLEEGRAWMRTAKESEAEVACLRAGIERALAARECPVDRAVAEESAEDEGSCCFDGGAAEGNNGRLKCRGCGEGDVRVLLLPCRHLCLCTACESKLDTCPVCGSTQDASLRVFLD